jgi:hypothetical protein
VSSAKSVVTVIESELSSRMRMSTIDQGVCSSFVAATSEY